MRSRRSPFLATSKVNGERAEESTHLFKNYSNVGRFPLLSKINPHGGLKIAAVQSNAVNSL